MLEDAAQAIGTRYQGRQIGSFGNPVSFSFHPNKNMTTIEGGAVASSDPELIKQLESIRFHGISRNDNGEMQVEAWGGKMNLPDVNAAIGLAQLKKLDGFNAKRRLLAEHYFKQLPRHPALVLPADAPGHSWHMFCVCLDFESLGISREDILETFKAQDIMLGMHYPAMHLFGLYRQLGYDRGDFPVAEQIGDQTFTLPLFPAMTIDDVDRVVAVFNQSAGMTSHSEAVTRAVVFAYHDIGVRCLEALLELGIEVSLVVTHEDNDSEQIWFDSVEEWQKETGLQSSHRMTQILPP